MNDSNRFEGYQLLSLFKEANDLLQYVCFLRQPTPPFDESHRWESGQFHWGEFQDQCFKELPREPALDYFMRHVYSSSLCKLQG